jgi:hypothetical protein
LPEADADWVLVPREPTPGMLRAGFLSESEGFGIDTPADAPGLVYRAMIAAAPTPGARLLRDLRLIERGELPDGDGVDTSTALWAEQTLARLAAPEAQGAEAQPLTHNNADLAQPQPQPDYRPPQSRECPSCLGKGVGAHVHGGWHTPCPQCQGLGRVGL